jgi:cation transport regulator ChaB
LCASAIAQLSKGRNKEDKDATAAPELHSLAAAAVEKEYKQKAPDKLQLISSALRILKT